MSLILILGADTDRLARLLATKVRLAASYNVAVPPVAPSVVIELPVFVNVIRLLPALMVAVPAVSAPL